MNSAIEDVMPKPSDKTFPDAKHADVEPLDRRSRKRLATRRAISLAADRLFFERGFENVTVDEIAAAADVGRMTVFNHFPRKEDMFFDRDAEARETLWEALRQRDGDVSPIETLRLLAYRLVAEQAPYLQFSVASRGFIETVENSETLKARARAIRDEIAGELAAALAKSVGRDADDPTAKLAGAMLLATWNVAFVEAHRSFRQQGDSEKAKSLFLGLVDMGTLGVSAALKGTAYV
jgi:AcrR family transcriptional regulator